MSEPRQALVEARGLTKKLLHPQLALIRMAAVTHSLDNDQRLVPVTPKTVRGTKDKYTLRLPSSKGVLLPGNYMLFAPYANGTPSVAKIINIR